jgi:hypothetical protein
MARRTSYDPTRPKYEWGNGWTNGDVSEKQAEFIRALCANNDVELVSLVGMTKGIASRLIDELNRKGRGDPHSNRYLARDFAAFVTVK